MQTQPTLTCIMTLFAKLLTSLLSVSSASMGQIYEEHADEDGFLYIAYSGENTFGSC